MKGKLNNIFEIKKVLIEEGVYAYGFGHIAKVVMFDHELSCTAKGIYAYFCSFTNSKNTAYPKLSTILKDLGIDKKTFYKHFKQLTDNGYITIKKAKGYKNKNVYVINEYVQKVKCDLSDDNDTESSFIVEGIKSHGYGTIPKLVMIDNRLTIKAKALMAFLLSLSGAGKCSFPRRDAICMRLNVTLNTYKSMMNELVSCGYIIVKQRRSKRGSFTINDYHFVIHPVEHEVVDVEKSIVVDNNVESCGKVRCEIEEKTNATSDENQKNGLNSGFSPWTKNSPLLNSDRGPKIPPSPRTKNSPPNINTNNTISIIGTSILHPDNKVINSIKPIGIELKNTLHNMSNYNDYQFDSDNYAKKYCKTVDIIISIFSESTVFHKEATINTTDLWNCFVHILRVNYQSETSCVDFIFDLLIYYDQCKAMYHIDYPVKYLRALIIDKIINEYDNSILI